VLYRFVWNELCDWYLEVAKTRLYSADTTERLQVSGNLLYIIEQVMVLLHPLMPFVTEEIYSYLPQVVSGRCPASLFDARYPDLQASWVDPGAEAAMAAFTSIVGGLRSAREELGLARDVVGKVVVLEVEPGAASALAGPKGAFRQLSGCELLQVVSAGGSPAGRYASIEGPGVKALLDLEGLVDIERERGRLVAKAQKADGEAAKAWAKLDNPGFLAKAPEAVVAEERGRLVEAEAVLEEVRRQYAERIGGELPVDQRIRS
jgi:valyl-tRNA synthetase